MDNKTGLFTNAVIWFGVAISVSEIEAGIQIASSSPVESVWIPLILGHVVGGILLFFAGLIGARLRVNAMETITSTFGKYGSKFFAFLNVMQLIAWVAVLNAQGAIALMGLNLGISFPLICVILASLIAAWVYVGIRKSSKIASAVMIVLTLLLAVLTFKLCGNSPHAVTARTLTFWNIFEISIAMPISWLPVISDYTKDAQKPLMATAVSALSYTVASLWMYYIGIQTVLFGSSNISEAILLSGLGVQGIIIMVLSTVTSNFLAANSAGESAKAIYNRINPKIAGVVVSALSAVVAISGIMNHYIDFLYLISSVFAPMASVLIVSFYLGDENTSSKRWIWNIFAWFSGFVTYQITVGMDSILLGPTLISIIVSALLAYLWIFSQNINKYKNHFN